MAQPRFRYRLEKILELKIKAEDDEKEKLAALLQEEEREKLVKQELLNKLASVRVELKERQHDGTLDINALRAFPQHIKYLENQIVNQDLRLRELAIRIKDQRDNLMQAAQERQAYEKNKEKNREKWTAEMDAKEATMLDELATIKAAREVAQ